MSKEDYFKKYEGFKTPESLTELISFSLETKGFFADSFEFEPENIKYMYESYAAEKEFTDSFICIGRADAGYSEYAFWANEENDLTNAPIVAFGGEGGYHIVAHNFDELVRILTFDSEPMISWDSIDYYKDEDDYKPNEHAIKFHDWVKTKLKMDVVKTNVEVEKIISKATEIHQLELKNWIGKFYKE